MKSEYLLFIEWMGYDIPEQLKWYETDRIIRFQNDLEKEIKYALQCAASNEEGNLVGSIESEFSWFTSEVETLSEKYDKLKENNEKLYLIIDSLFEELRNNLSEEQEEEFQKYMLWKRLSEKYDE